jgi:two-component system NtrC family sensor kinase
VLPLLSFVRAGGRLKQTCSRSVDGTHRESLINKSDPDDEDFSAPRHPYRQAPGVLVHTSHLPVVASPGPTVTDAPSTATTRRSAATTGGMSDAWLSPVIDPDPGWSTYAGARQLFLATCAVGIASIVVLLSAPAGIWRFAAGAVLLLVAAAVGAERAVMSTSVGALVDRMNEVRDRLAVQQAEHDRYAALLAATNQSVVITSLEGVITDWNPAAAQLFGYAADEVVGRPVREVFSAAAPEIDVTVAQVVAGESATLDTVHVREDGSELQICWHVSRIVDQDGRPYGLVGFARDIGERRTREAEFHQESKLESLGRLSAGLAHEINSPIQFVGDNARFLEEAYEELIRVVGVYRGLLDTSNPIGWMERQERVREAEASIDFDYLQTEIPSAVEQTLEGIQRVSTIVRAMKTFSHPGHKEHAPADLNEAVEATITVVRHQINDVADLSLQLGALLPVRCNIAELNQVFLNLIVNAADAIEETGQRGMITVATSVDGEDAVIRIEDTGCGISEDVRAKMFDPFFTTKDVGRGTGQGLALARGVVHEGHGGALTVDSALGRGTTFTVRIPINGRPQEEPAEGELPRSLVSA